MFEQPLVLWLLLAAPLVVIPGWLAMRAGRRAFGALSAAMRLGCFVALVMMLAGLRLPIRAAAHGMAVVIALDESRSIAPDQHKWMQQQVAEIRRAMDPTDRLAVVGFARETRLLSPLDDPRLASPGVAEMAKPLASGNQIDSGATDIAGALTVGAGIFPDNVEKRLLLLTDGNETQGSALDELPAMSENQIRLFDAAPPTPGAPRVAITNFAVPTMVRAQTSFALHLDVESEADKSAPANLKLLADGVLVGSRQLTLAPGANRFELPLRLEHAGAYLMRAELSIAPPLIVTNAATEAALTVAPAPRVLVIGNSPPQTVIDALRLRNYAIDSTGPHGLPVRPEDYLAYQAVIIANVPAEALGEDVQTALNRYVADLGGGLIVTGDTLRDSKFHGSTLEKTLPVTFEPQPPPPSREPVAVYLLIDRSNSMSYNSRYPAVRDGERIRYAKQAAAALLNQLDDTDYAGVIAFDSEPYVLGHLRPLAEDRAELVDRVQRLEPGGGTDFLDALIIAQREILASAIPVREVILLTDGDTNRQYHDHDQLMADYAKQGIPVSTIRIGPDLENLRLLQDFAQNTGGIFYRVEDITKLPQLLVHLTHEAQNFKLREKSHIDIGGRSSILNGIGPNDLPAVDFFAETRPRDGAEVPLIVRKGNVSVPLLATWQYELGRSAIFAADPDSMGSLAWIRWNRYAEFWSQMLSWVARAGDPGPFTLRVTDAPGGTVKLEAEKVDTVPVTNLVCRITGSQRAVDVAMTQVGASLYDGESAPLPRGKYSISLMLKAGDMERVLVSREIAVPGVEAADAAEMRLHPPNLPLLRELARGTGGEFDAPTSHILQHRGALVTTYRPVDSSLLPAVILMLLGEVFIRRRYLSN